MINTVSEIRNVARPILMRHGVTRAAVFGSYARGDMNADSDVDMLVEINKDISLLDFIHIKNDIEDALGQRVDLVEYGALKPLFMESILQEQVTIL